MKRALFAAGFATILACTPALAEWRLFEGLKIVQACAGDVSRLCAGVKPGGGRVIACLKERVAQLPVSCIDPVLGALIDAHEGNVTIPLKPGATPGLEVHLSLIHI